MTENTTGREPARHASRRAGRPAQPLLSREIIADAALGLVTAAGVDGLTMKSLAGELGVSVSSLYNHIANKADLLVSVQDAVMSRVDAGAFSALTPGVVSSVGRQGVADLLAAALRSWSRSYRRAFADYPSMVPLIATMPVTGAPATRRMYDMVAAGLLAAGVPSEQVVPVIVAFESFLFGSAMDVHAPASIFGSRPGEEDAPAFRSAVDAFTARVDAATGGSATGGPGVPNPYADPPFGWGLDALVAGVLVLLPE